MLLAAPSSGAFFSDGNSLRPKPSPEPSDSVLPESYSSRSGHAPVHRADRKPTVDVRIQTHHETAAADSPESRRTDPVYLGLTNRNRIVLLYPVRHHKDIASTTESRTRIDTARSRRIPLQSYSLTVYSLNYFELK